MLLSDCAHRCWVHMTFDGRVQSVHSFVKLVRLGFCEGTHPRLYAVSETRGYLASVVVDIGVWIEADKHDWDVSEILIQLAQALVVA